MGFTASVVLSLILAFLVWLAIQFLRRRLFGRELPPGARLPPMPPSSSYRGHVEIQAHDFFKTKALEWASLYGPVYRLKFNGMNIVVVNDFESTRKFLNTNEILYRSKTLGTHREYFAGVGSLNGKLWSANKKFCMTMLRDLGFARTTMEDKMMEEFSHLAEKIRNTNGEPINVREYIQPCASSNIASFFYARRLPPDHPSRQKLQNLITELFVHFQAGPLYHFFPTLLRRILERLSATRLGRISASMTALEKFTEKQILDYKAEQTTDVSRDFIHQYIRKIEETKEDSKPLFTHRYLVGNVNAFIIGGTVSTTNTMWWLLLLCAKYPDEIQARIQREIDGVVGPDRRPTWDDRKQMPYTQACILEVERWKTSAPLGAPRESSDDVVIDGYFIEKGTTVLPNLWAIHNDPTLWPDPYKFNPHRFLNDDGTMTSHIPEQLVPFGIGRRSCPGEVFASMEIFLMVTFLLQKYHVVPEHPIRTDLNDPNLRLPQQVPNKLRFLRRQISKA
ncbi:vitamin D 25-hydroxylase-like [Haemaphysalis longicornis]